MNNDDTFKNNKNNDRASAGLTPELEVRVVAWVLGEATPAEAAQLARLADENPALAEFKRRIEAVHGLVGEAARPVADTTLRLSDERRAKVLAVIGEDTGGGRGKTTGGAARRTPRWVQAWNKWALPMAACITLCVLLGAVMGPELALSKKPKRPNPSSTVLGAERTEMRAVSGPSGSVEMQQKDTITSTDVPMVAFQRESQQQDKLAARRGGLLNSDEDGGHRENAPFATAPMPPPEPTAAPASGGASSGRVTLSEINTYPVGTGVSGGKLALVSDEKSAAGSGSSPLAETQKALSLGTGTPAAPAMPSSASVVNEMVAGSGDNFGYATGMVQANGGVAKFAGRLSGSGGVAGGGTASTSRSRRVRGDDGSTNQEQSLGDLSVRGHALAKSEAVDALKCEPSKPVESVVAYGSASDMTDLPAGSSLTLGSTGLWAYENKKDLDRAPAIPKPAKQRQTVTITAGTPQEFEARDVTASESQALGNNSINAAADHFAPPASAPARVSDETMNSEAKDQRQLQIGRAHV